MMSYDMEYPFSQLGSVDTTISPSNFMSTPSPLAGGALQGAEDALTLSKHCPGVTETLMCSP